MIYSDPLIQTVWPVWTGQVPLPGWRYGERFARNLMSLVASGTIQRLSPRWQFAQILPLVSVQALAIFGLWKVSADRNGVRQSRRSPTPAAKNIARSERAITAQPPAQPELAL